MHVSFIDDNEDQIARYREYLCARGCSVSYYDWSDGGQAFFSERAIETNLVVVLDLYFGIELMGPAILNSLHQWRPELPVIVLTQTSRPADVAEVHDWGGTRAFMKSSGEFIKLWETVKQSANVTQERRGKLREALALANSPTSASQFLGLLRCREIMESEVELQIPALQGKYLALRGLLDHGTKQDHLPLIDVLKELRDTCFKLHSEKLSDRDNLQTWVMACKHLGEPHDLAQLGAACLIALRYDDLLLQNLIQWQASREKVQGVSAASSSLTHWPSFIEEDAQTTARLNLALALRISAEEIARVVAEAYAAYLCDLGKDAVFVIEREFTAFQQETVLDILTFADPEGQKMSPILMRVVKCRLENDTSRLGILVSTVPLIERLSNWRANSLERSALQHCAANLAFHLYANPGTETYRDRCLAIACQECVHSGEVATTVLDVLAEIDVEKLVATYDTWLRWAKSGGKADLFDVLVQWAITNREKILQGTVELPLLQRLIATLAQAGQHKAAVDYVLQVLEAGLTDLRIVVPKNKVKDTMGDFRNLLNYAKQHAAGDLLGRIEQLENKLTQSAVAAFELPGILTGKRMAIVAGTRVTDGAKLPNQYRELVEKHLGSTCELFDPDAPARIDALAGAIRGGGFHFVVVVRGSVAHKPVEKIKEACKQAASNRQQVTLLEIPTAAVGARAVLMGIVDKLGLPPEEHG